MFPLAGMIIYVGLFLIFILGIGFYGSKNIWIEIISWLLMLPFILLTSWLIIYDVFIKLY